MVLVMVLFYLLTSVTPFFGSREKSDEEIESSLVDRRVAPQKRLVSNGPETYSSAGAEDAR